VNETKLSVIGLAVLAGFIILYFVVKRVQAIKTKFPDMDLSYIINELGKKEKIISMPLHRQSFKPAISHSGK
jgi:hypothetical protein